MDSKPPRGISAWTSPSFDSCLEDRKYEQAVLADQQMGMKSGVNGTPCLIIGDSRSVPDTMVGSRELTAHSQPQRSNQRSKINSATPTNSSVSSPSEAIMLQSTHNPIFSSGRDRSERSLFVR